MSKILITGGAGYIGSVLVPELLSKGHHITVYDSMVFGANHLIPYLKNDNFYLKKGDILDRTHLSSVLSEGFDHIIHLAALVFSEDKLKPQVLNTNYQGTKNLVDLIPETTNLLFLSTCSVYGCQPGSVLKEESPSIPTNTYAESKLLSEKYIQEKLKKFIIFRAATVFGCSPRMRFDLVVNDLTLAAFALHNLVIGNPDSHRPGIHIRTLTNLLQQVVDQDATSPTPINVGTVNYAKSELVDILRQKIPGLNVSQHKKDFDSRDYSVSFDKMNSLFDSEAIPLDYGIDEILGSLKLEIFKKPFSPIYQNLRTYEEIYRR